MPRAFVVVGLGYGDEGKGSITDYLVRKHGAELVVRYNGGPQAAHNVVLPDGRHHTFSQFGSGTFVPGVKTYLSRHMMINPFNIFTENEHLESLGIHDALSRLYIDQDALVVTPFHVAANRLKELARGPERRHGSCGQGVGEAYEDMCNGAFGVIRAKDLKAPDLRKQLDAVQGHKKQEVLERGMANWYPEGWPIFNPYTVDHCLESYACLADLVHIVDHYDLPETTIFEGAQGIMLDQDYGTQPYTTWSKTTTHNVENLRGTDLKFNGGLDKIEIGVMRGYATRHGAGPLPTEDNSLTWMLPEEHNGHNPWQQGFRVGHTDIEALRYALTVTDGVDCLAVTCLDRLEGSLIDPDQLCNVIEDELETPITIKSYGPTYQDKWERIYGSHEDHDHGRRRASDLEP